MVAIDFGVAEPFAPLLQPQRYKGAWGGRGGGKSHFFAGYLVTRALAQPGLRAVGIREVQRSLAQSVKQLIEDKIDALGVGRSFDVLEAEIRGPGDGLIVFQGMQNHTADSIKSLEGFDVAWFEEAQKASSRSLTMLRPTIRKPGSEIWFSWNPEHDYDPVDQFLRGPLRAPNATVVCSNYTDNPWVTQELIDEAELDKADPDKYAHVWLGEYARVVEGAYYADCLRQAQLEERILPLALDPIQTIRAAWDIGIADATAIWIAQFVGMEIRLLDYIEGSNQPLGYYLEELRRRGYGRAVCLLPHDGAHRDKHFGMRYVDNIRAAGFEAPEPQPNMGRGADMLRVEAARRWFPRMKFDVDKTAAGRKALAAYHERIDETRQVGLGPEHDWASHAADAFGLLAQHYQEPTTVIRAKPREMSWIV